MNLKHGNPIELKYNQKSMTIPFTYSVEWVPTSVDFENRFESLLEADFFEHKVNHFLQIGKIVKRDYMLIMQLGPLALHIQLFYDGFIFDWACICHLIKNCEKRFHKI